VVCHNDFAPYNFVFTDERLTAVIDVDMASPGSRAWDLAYLAYRLAPLGDPANPDALPSDPSERRRRLRLLCAAYAGAHPVADADPDAVLRQAPPRLLELADSSDARASVLPALAAHARLYRADAAWITANRAALA
jgi:Ser/Thr protein kinase RdoA (MazF antagonist)